MVDDIITAEHDDEEHRPEMDPEAVAVVLREVQENLHDLIAPLAMKIGAEKCGALFVEFCRLCAGYMEAAKRAQQGENLLRDCYIKSGMPEDLAREAARVKLDELTRNA